MEPLALVAGSEVYGGNVLVLARVLPAVLQLHVQLLFRKTQPALLQVLLWETRFLTRPFGPGVVLAVQGDTIEVSLRVLIRQRSS